MTRAAGRKEFLREVLPSDAAGIFTPPYESWAYRRENDLL